MKTRILSTAEVEKYLTIELAINTVDFVFKEFGSGNIVMPPKIHLDMSKIGHESWCNAMPAYIGDQKTGGIKWMGGFGNNRKQNLPYIMGVVLLTDPHTGFVKAIMDGRAISDFRTGASAAVFARYLSMTPLEHILIVGAGVQGQMAAKCLHHEFPESRIGLYDLSAERVRGFKETQTGTTLGDKLDVSGELESDCRKSQLVVLLTTAQSPFVKNEWIEKGTTVLGMGTYQQIEDDFALTCDKIVPDSWAQAKGRGEMKPLYLAGKIRDNDCYEELSGILAGKKPGRENDTERIFGLPVGLGAHDVAIGEIIYENAKQQKEGVEIEIQSQ